MGFAGRLEGIAPSDIFQIISQGRMTGTLIARCPDGTAMIVFMKGQVIEAASDAPEESLGHLLVAQGLIGNETLAAAQEHWKQRPEQPLGTILVDMGAISEKKLKSVALKQIEHVVNRLVSCEDGFITFDSGDMALKRKLNTHEFTLSSGVSAEYLMMEGARAIDEERRSGKERRTSADGGRRTSDEAAVEAFRAAMSVEAASLWSRYLASAVGQARRLGAAVSTAASEIKRAVLAAITKLMQFTTSVADGFRKSVLPSLESAWNRATAFSPDGRKMIVAGAVVGLAGLILTLAFALQYGSAKDALVVTGRVVNIRANPTTGSMVITQVEQGDTLFYVSSQKGWHKVRTRSGGTGWVWESLVERGTGDGLTISYDLKGFEFLIVAGVVMFVVGIRRRHAAGSDAPLLWWMEPRRR